MTDELTTLLSSDPLVLTRDDWRVEIHWRQDADGLATLLAYAGRDIAPERVTQQGPFQSVAQAIGARGAIVKQLLAKGYCLRGELHPAWTINVKRDIRVMRERKAQSGLRRV